MVCFAEHHCTLRTQPLTVADCQHERHGVCGGSGADYSSVGCLGVQQAVAARKRSVERPKKQKGDSRWPPHDWVRHSGVNPPGGLVRRK